MAKVGKEWLLKKMEKRVVGNCPLCGRDLIEGPSVNEHHLLPKTFKGKETVLIHKICHSKIHSVFTERELLNFYHTIDRLLAHEEIAKFVNWVQKKDPEYRDGNHATKQIRDRRRRK
jgi:hypothetical protein